MSNFLGGLMATEGPEVLAQAKAAALANSLPQSTGESGLLGSALKGLAKAEASLRVRPKSGPEAEPKAKATFTLGGGGGEANRAHSKGRVTVTPRGAKVWLGVPEGATKAHTEAHTLSVRVVKAEGPLTASQACQPSPGPQGHLGWLEPLAPSQALEGPMALEAYVSWAEAKCSSVLALVKAQAWAQAQAEALAATKAQAKAQGLKGAFEAKAKGLEAGLARLTLATNLAMAKAYEGVAHCQANRQPHKPEGEGLAEALPPLVPKPLVQTALPILWGMPEGGQPGQALEAATWLLSHGLLSRAGGRAGAYSLCKGFARLALAQARAEGPVGLGQPPALAVCQGAQARAKAKALALA